MALITNDDQYYHCRICNSTLGQSLFDTKIHDKSAHLHQCPKCEYIQFVQPNWLNQAYESTLNLEDVGIIQRNLKFSRILISLTICNAIKFDTLVDLGGGTGLMVRLLRDAGINAYWDDPYCENVFAKQFVADCAPIEKFDVACAFEVVEHVLDPKTEIERALLQSDTIIFSTELANNIKNLEDWWYLGVNHGQHIGFLTTQTIEYIAEQNNCDFYTNGKNLHIISKTILPKRRIKISIRLSKFIYLFRSIFLKSKTWQDFHYIGNTN